MKTRLTTIALGCALSASAYAQGGKMEIPVENKNTANAKIKVLKAYYTGGNNCQAMEEATIEVFGGTHFYISFNPFSEKAKNIYGYKLPEARDPREPDFTYSRCLLVVDFVADANTKVAFKNFNLRGTTKIAPGHVVELGASIGYGREVVAETTYRTRKSTERQTVTMRPLTLGISTKTKELPCGGEFRVAMDFLFEIRGKTKDPSGSWYKIISIDGEQEVTGISYDFNAISCS